MISIYTANKKRIFIFFIFFICSILNSFAQDEPTFEEDVVDNPPPTTPIDFWIFPLIILGLLYAYILYRNLSYKENN